jgi:hypothetical protein
MLDFLGIGAQKSGTTWVYENLKRHPEVIFPSGIKEMHFWDLHFDKGLPWYLSQFPDVRGKVSGEITPAYAIMEEAHIRLLSGLNPELRLFYILRDPRARAWSAALMEMERAGKAYKDTSAEWFIDQFYSDASLKRGDYQTCLEHWREVFPGKRLLVLKFSDIRERPHGLMQEIASHIGASPAFFAPEAGNVTLQKVFSTPPFVPKPQLKRVLNKIYAPQIERLNHYLGEAWFEEDTEDWKENA